MRFFDLVRRFAFLGLAGAGCAWAAPPAAEFAARHEVWLALRSACRQDWACRGIRSEDDLQASVWPLDPRADELEVAEAAWDQIQHRARFRLRCKRANRCLPFLVFGAPGPRPGPMPSAALARATHEDAAPASAALARPSPAALVTPGARVHLLRETERMRLTQPAVCLEQGSVGDRVRARLEASGRIVQAVVVAPDLVVIHEESAP